MNKETPMDEPLTMENSTKAQKIRPNSPLEWTVDMAPLCNWSPCRIDSMESVGIYSKAIIVQRIEVLMIGMRDF